MKQIINWRKATVADIEADGLLDAATKLHVLAYKLDGKDVSAFHGTQQVERIKAFYQYHIDNKIPVVGHSFILFDVPVSEKLLGIDLSELMVIDTLALSWYLNFHRKQHGLDSFFEDYGIKKPKVDDWENLSYEEYRNRCVEDVKINTALWEDLKERLIDMYTISSQKIDEGVVGGSRVDDNEELYIDSLKGLSVDDHINRILTFLMHKMDCAALQEKTKWEVDVEYLVKTEGELSELIAKAKEELESVMPPIPKYVARKEPAKPYKKNGELSAAGLKWQELKDKLASGEVDELGNPLCKVVEVGKIHELTEYSPPNIGSHQQVKDFLFSKGWEPITFKSVRDEKAFQEWVDSKPREGSPRGAWTAWKNSKPEDRKIPQISVEGEDGKELCESVVELAEIVPEVKALENYSVIFHRLSMIRGFLKNLQDGKYLSASVGGFTNTLRMQHRGLVNLPAANKPFAEAIRGCLIAGEGKVSLGSDLSGLEDRTKHHFMIPLDPEYVATMMEDDYDAHIYMAYGSGLISEKQYLDFKRGVKTPEVVEARRKGKTLNYACLPTDNTEVLTDSGWKHFEDITLEDKVLSLNNETGNTEFCSILNTVFYENREVLSLQVGQNWKVESTPDHRWVVERGNGLEYVTTKGLSEDCKIVESAKVEGGLKYVSLKGMKKHYSRSTDVFCLTTENSNFVIRQNGVITITGNCVYGAGGAKIAETLKVPVEEGKELVEGYWKVNWSVEAIAKEQVVIECSKGFKWLINPINGFLYSIRSEKDVFSTLAQGTGAFFFDMWVDNIITEMKSRWGKATLTGQFHDEIILVIKDDPKIKETFEALVRESLEKVNHQFKLRRSLGCDVQFGQRYSEIH